MNARHERSVIAVRTGTRQRRCACGEPDGACCGSAGKNTLMRRASGPGPDRVPAEVHAVLGSPGRPLDAATRSFMEHGFGRDLSAVRVHSGADAAQSARAVSASAYTVGNNVVLGAGQPSFHTPAGALLLAHELTHVLQQGAGSAPTSQKPTAIGHPHDAAEQEASHTAEKVVSGMGAAGPRRQSPAGTIQRTVAGDVGGTLVGAAAGAGIGAGIGSVGGGLGAGIGALIGGVVGGIAGLIAGEAATTHPRPLDADEKAAAESVFGASLNYARVRVAESSLMSAGGYARTPFETVYFPIGQRKKQGYLPFLVHELTHVWQTQHGISFGRKLITAMRGASAYSYKGSHPTPEDALRADRAKGKTFLQYNTEQQGDICEDYYRRLMSGDDVSAYLPFIQEVRNGGRSGPK